MIGIKQKNIGEYKVALVKTNSSKDTMMLMFWSKVLGEEIYKTNIMEKGRATSLYSALNTEPKIKDYLRTKARITPSILKMNW